VPSEQTTVVPEFAGTTTVVLFCGAGGLLLLMHPDSAASTTSEANMVFMLNPLGSLNDLVRRQHAGISGTLNSSALGTDRR
jgi:hypothetical protein